MKLRDYQVDLIEKTRDSFRRGSMKPLVVLPCGGGKTVCFAYMASENVKKGGYVYFFVHRRELVDQTIETFKNFGIDMSNVYIGMVQSATKIKDIPEPTLIIFDEAHHAAASTWKVILEKWPGVHVVGLTATPKRQDGKSLAAAFDDLVVGVTAKWLIDNKYLSDFDYYAPKLSTLNTADFKIRGSEYDMSQVSDVMLASKIYGDIKKYLNFNRKTIIYAPSIEFSKMLEREIPGVVHFDGTTKASDRSLIVERFRRGEIKVLSNVDLIGEGFDVPDCEVVMLLRPTQSLTLFIQQSMRALRYKENKRATIYDMVGNVFTHGLPTQYENWELEGTVRNKPGAMDELKIRMCNSCFRVYEGKGPLCPYCGFDNGKTKLEILQDESAELEKIEEMKKKEARREVGMAKSMDELIAIGKSRGYKNPKYWAMQVMKNRNRRSKNI